MGSYSDHVPEVAWGGVGRLSNLSNLSKLMWQGNGSSGIWVVSVSYQRGRLKSLHFILTQSVSPWCLEALWVFPMGEQLSPAGMLRRRSISTLLGCFGYFGSLEGLDFHICSRRQGLNTFARGMWLCRGAGCCIGGLARWRVDAHWGPGHSRRPPWSTPAVGRFQSHRSRR